MLLNLLRCNRHVRVRIRGTQLAQFKVPIRSSSDDAQLTAAVQCQGLAWSNLGPMPNSMCRKFTSRFRIMRIRRLWGQISVFWWKFAPTEKNSVVIQENCYFQDYFPSSSIDEEKVGGGSTGQCENNYCPRRTAANKILISLVFFKHFARGELEWIV